MSRVYLLAADKPLPLCNKQTERASTSMVNGTPYTISFLRGFRVDNHTYYRHATDLLNYPIKPYQYELTLELHEEDLIHLKQYLTENFSAGETAELWCIWVDDCVEKPVPPHYRGRLADFDMETLTQFLQPPAHHDAPGQCFLTITI